MRVRLSTLGRLSLAVDGTTDTSIVGQPVRAALLLLVAIERVTTREMLAGMLWPDSDPSRARHVLSQTLYQLRDDLGESVLAADRGTLRVGDDLWVDATAFEQAAASSRLDEAAELYRGPFVPGVRLVETNAFETWVDIQRARLARINRRVRRARAEALRRMGAGGEALAAARDWVDVDPLEDEARHGLMTLLAESGRRGEALRQYDELVELLAREGLGPLEQTAALAERLRRPDPSVAGVPDRETAPARVARREGDPSRHPAAPVGTPRWTGRRSLALSALLAGAALGVVFAAGPLGLVGVGDEPALSDDRVLVMPLDNATGDPALAPVGDMAADWISEGLARTGRLRIVPTVEVLRRLDARGARSVEGSTVAAEMAVDAGAGLLVSGRYYRRGDSLELHAQITEVVDGELWLALEPVRASVADPGPAIARLRERIAGTLAARASPDIPLEPPSVSHPPTWEAWLAYRKGVDRFIRGDFEGALPELVRANALDTGFVRPLLLAASAYSNLRDPAREDSVVQVIAQRADNLAPYERAHLEYEKASLRGDQDGAYNAAKEIVELTPGGPPHYVLASIALTVGRPREAIDILESLDPAPPWMPAWWSRWPILTGAYHALGEHGLELDEARQAARADPRPQAASLELRALAALGRVEEARERLASWLERFPDADPEAGSVMLELAQELRRHGHGAAADELGERTVAWYRSHAVGASSAGRGTDRVRALIAAGRWAEADTLLTTLRTESPQLLGYTGMEGVVASGLGDDRRAQWISGQLAELDRPYMRGENTFWRAAIAAQDGHPGEALQLLVTARGEGAELGFRMHADPLFRRLWLDPGYQNLVVGRR